MEEVKHEEDELNNDKQLFLRQFKIMKEQSLTMGDHQSKKREYEMITPTVQPQNNLDTKVTSATKVHH